MSVEIDWNSDKAKGKDWCLYDDNSNTYIFCGLKPIADEDENRWVDSGYLAGYPLLDCYELYERPKAEKQSVYTQEMADAGELPKVSMSFLAFNPACADYVEFVCISEGLRLNGDALISAECTVDGSILFFDKRHIDSDGLKPIDQRTDKQKTIQKLANRMKNIDVGSWSDDAECLLNEIINNEFEFIKYTGKDND